MTVQKVTKTVLVVSKWPVKEMRRNNGLRSIHLKGCVGNLYGYELMVPKTPMPVVSFYALS